LEALGGFDSTLRGLVAAGLLSEPDIVERVTELNDASRRNRNTIVTVDSVNRLLLKRSSVPLYSAKREAESYARLTLHHSHLGAVVPRSFGYSQELDSLILEYVVSSESMRSLLLRRIESGVIRRSHALGRILGGLHASDASSKWPILDPPSTDGARVDYGGNRSSAQPSLLEEAVLSSLPQLERRLSEIWQPASVIHGDIRLDNWLVGVSPINRSRTWLVDWESAGVGDPAWDVGSFLGEVLAVWIQSIPIWRTPVSSDELQLAGLPLNRAQTAIRAFWTAYAGEVSAGAGPWEPLPQLLIRSTIFAAARLMYCALESAAVVRGTRLELEALVGVARNILERPLEATTSLLGLQLSS